LIFLIRHGQTEFNVQRRLQGRMDSPLTELGVEQARRMGEVLKAVAGEPERWRVISSPLGRTLRTAEIVRETIGLGCEIETDDRLMEIDVGGWEGLNGEEIEAMTPGARSASGWLLTAPGGETWETASARVAAWLDEHDLADGSLRLVVSHGITGRILRALYERESPEDLWAAAAPPQDSVFRLWQGAIYRLDEGA
jgi:probable phosphoglycerate mutase